MTKNKNNKTIWNTRIKKNTSTLFQKVGSSIDVDKIDYIQRDFYHIGMKSGGEYSRLMTECRVKKIKGTDESDNKKSFCNGKLIFLFEWPHLD